MGKPIPGRPGVTKNPAATIFARNLPFAATEGDLEAFFARVREPWLPSMIRLLGPIRLLLEPRTNMQTCFNRQERLLTSGVQAMTRAGL